jgi:hypothetical protein
MRSPGNFTLELVATAEREGRSDCSVQATGSATASISDQPTMTVFASTETINVCSDSTAAYVDVVFGVQTDTGDLIGVPSTITASDGRNCTLQGNSDNCK